ncbi:class I SAM-dependent methyltransferase [Aquirufa sp. ROCK2-A2]
MLNDSEILFIEENLLIDPFQLALKKKKIDSVDFQKVVHQIHARQKLKDKLPTWVAQPSLFFPANISLEQSSSEQTSQFKACLISGRIIDITGGMGVDAWAFAKAGNQVDYVEKQEDLVKISQYNHQILLPNQIKHHHTDGISYLHKHYEDFDYVYLDPARRNVHGDKVLLFKDCQPNVMEILPFIDKGLNLLIKTSPLLDIDRAVNELNGVDEVYVVALKGEVKELLFKKTKNASEHALIHVIELSRENPFIFSQTRAFEKEQMTTFSQAKRYLYEAHPGLMKAGFFKSICQLGVEKISQHTHLYTSDQIIENFPGKIFQVLTAGTADTKWINDYIPEKRGNIITRNFPQSSVELRKKWKLGDGGDKSILAYQNFAGKNEVAICRKVQ